MMNGQFPSIEVESISNELDADVLLYFGDLNSPYDRYLMTECAERSKRPNLLLILVTDGGDPDCAYRIGRYLQQNYSRFSIFVPELCKSAGTLLALGAHEIILGEFGEMGPLDLQHAKIDDLLGLRSVLAVSTAMSDIQAQTIQTFEQVFLDLTFRSDNRITLNTATQVASKLATDLFGPLLAKLDPLDIGERARELAIAQHYGTRLIEHSQNMERLKLDTLIQSYPSHGFVIDRREAKELFNNCRDATPIEQSVANAVSELAEELSYMDDTYFEFLSEPIDNHRNNNTSESTEA